jgi:hypothetical protein
MLKSFRRIAKDVVDPANTVKRRAFPKSILYGSVECKSFLVRFERSLKLTQTSMHSADQPQCKSLPVKVSRRAKEWQRLLILFDCRTAGYGCPLDPKLIPFPKSSIGCDMVFILGRRVTQSNDVYLVSSSRSIFVGSTNFNPIVTRLLSDRQQGFGALPRVRAIHLNDWLVPLVKQSNDDVNSSLIYNCVEKLSCFDMYAK